MIMAAKIQKKQRPGNSSDELVIGFGRIGEYTIIVERFL
jgi:hypothetical protein